MTILRYLLAALTMSALIWWGTHPRNDTARNREIGVAWCSLDGHLGVETEDGCKRWDQYRAP